MTKKGKTPSLISGKMPSLIVAKGRRHCTRCKREICRGSRCADVPIPGTMGDKTYCTDCLLEIVEKSREDLNQIENQIRNVISP
ncbi:MAG: hypothetical protein Q8J68_09440 [Methanolobus sp.]|uniref:hypothetical protein n=1 Tax=Methanolobus sp. TaxID=1874737 RepID=UPI00272FE7F6|nr:hypothetical protein [Methanolobus sp.]MDP2217496.1 hypothetical protein [Methanolobus sp.]